MDTNQFYARLLKLGDPWQVENVTINEEAHRIDVFVGHHGLRQAACPECGRLFPVRDDAPERVQRHLNTCQMETFIHMRLPRVECAEHGIRTIGAQNVYSEGTAQTESLPPRLVYCLSLPAADARLIVGLINQKADELDARKHGRLLIDASALRSLDSRVIGALIPLLHKAQNDRIPVYFHAVLSDIFDLIHLVNLDKFMSMVADRTEFDLLKTASYLPTPISQPHATPRCVSGSDALKAAIGAPCPEPRPGQTPPSAFPEIIAGGQESDDTASTADHEAGDDPFVITVPADMRFNSMLLENSFSVYEDVNEPVLGINLSQISTLNSRHLGQLIRGVRTACHRNGAVVVYLESQALKVILESTNISRVVELVQTERDFHKALKTKSREVRERKIAP